ncbi:BQ5605_C001g00112 [Microbotryum silenes-dioicae]|uniref:BQ5605_C001g00112 protein n=1 Tax=Microbotryum silenes-dioicae TaxID=796604 RepID=A0A2X0MPR0_9BASI|nr:BQ5605_C001g00112 [Microbotryum silenes-dioicae]
MATPTAAEDLVATVFSTEAEAKVFYTELRSAGPEDRLQARCADVARAFLFSRTSGKWDHFDVVVFRSNGKLKIRATCKTRPASHCETVDFETAHQHGVSNWNRGIKQCLASRGEHKGICWGGVGP